MKGRRPRRATGPSPDSRLEPVGRVMNDRLPGGTRRSVSVPSGEPGGHAATWARSAAAPAAAGARARRVRPQQHDGWTGAATAATENRESAETRAGSVRTGRRDDDVLRGDGRAAAGRGATPARHAHHRQRGRPVPGLRGAGAVLQAGERRGDLLPDAAAATPPTRSDPAGVGQCPTYGRGPAASQARSAVDSQPAVDRRLVTGHGRRVA